MEICGRGRIGLVQTRTALFLLILLAISSLARSPHSAQSSESTQKILDLVHQGNTASAQQLLTEALRNSPRDANLYNLEGVVQAQSKDFAASEASFRKAIELAPGFADVYLNLGHLYQEWKPPQKAMREKALIVYAQLLKLDPGNVEANYQSAVLLMQQGLYTQSLRHLSSLPATAQDRAQALSVRCGDYAGCGAKLKAEEAGGRMLHSPDLQEADVLSILPLLTEHQETSLAVKLLEGLRQGNLAKANSLTELGLLYKQQGRLGDARQTSSKRRNCFPLLSPCCSTSPKWPMTRRTTRKRWAIWPMRGNSNPRMLRSTSSGGWCVCR